MKFNLQKMLRPHLVQLQSYGSLRKDVPSDQFTYLDANENPFGEFNRYPDGEQIQLKAKLAEINKVKSENLFLGNGSDELIDLVMRLFCEPEKDAILIMDSSFVMYEIYAKMNNLKVERLELNSNFQLETETFLQVASNSNAKILFLCSPNNPTGNSIEDIEFYIENFKGIVVADEAYIEFSPQSSTVGLLEKYPNLIVLKTLSKAYGMAGLRLGVGIASVEIATLFNQFKPPYNISSVSQKLALEELENIDLLENNIKRILEEKEKLKKNLVPLKSVVKIYPSDANFFLIEFQDAELVFKALLNENILTSMRHPKLKNCLRISIGTKAENERLLEILKTIN